MLFLKKKKKKIIKFHFENVKTKCFGISEVKHFIKNAASECFDIFLNPFSSSSSHFLSLNLLIFLALLKLNFPANVVVVKKKIKITALCILKALSNGKPGQLRSPLSYNLCCPFHGAKGTCNHVIL